MTLQWELTTQNGRTTIDAKGVRYFQVDPADNFVGFLVCAYWGNKERVALAEYSCEKCAMFAKREMIYAMRNWQLWDYEFPDDRCCTECFEEKHNGKLEEMK